MEYKNNFWYEIEKVDLNGDGKFETVYLTGYRDQITSVHVKDICLVIEVGIKKPLIVKLPFSEGYNPRIFHGIFNKGKVVNIFISIDSDCCGGCGHYYIYSFIDNILKLLFHKDFYNKAYKYEVVFKDRCCVGVHNHYLKKNHLIGIRDKDRYIHAGIYDRDGRLLKPTYGSMHGVYHLYPLESGIKGNYNLLAVNRVFGMNDADTVGDLGTTLEWDGTRFVPVSESLRNE